MILGMDCSIKNVAIVSNKGKIYIDVKTPLSLNSTENELIWYGKSIGNQLSDCGVSHLFIDAVHTMFSGRYKQFSYNQILITAIASASDAQIVFVSPSRIRKAIGLSSKAKKKDVWVGYSYSGSTIEGNEHVKDAFCLALYGVWSLYTTK